jgi:excisionase family DNA binding protein
MEAPVRALLDQTQPFVADEAEAAVAHAAAARLAPAACAGEPIQFVVRERPNIAVRLPARAVKLIYDVLEAMARRQPFSIVPHEAELSTQQAAEYLNVSRPFLVGLLDRGEIPHRMVGRHRRVRFSDLLDFEARSAAARKRAIADMAEEARRLGLE